MIEKRTQHPFYIYETIMGAGKKLETWFNPDVYKKINNIADIICDINPDHLFISGTGSSYMASIAQVFGFREIAGMKSSAHVTADLRAYLPQELTKNNVLLLNSHSGKSPGDAEMIKSAKERGVYTIAITDVEDTLLTRAADNNLIGIDGPKREMPATRTYSSSIFRTLLLAIECAKRRNMANAVSHYEQNTRSVPSIVDACLQDLDHRAPSIADSLKDQKAFYVISAGPNMATAIEGAMGLTQGTGKPAAGFHIDEYMHSPIQSLSRGMCVVVVASPGPFQEKLTHFASVAENIGATVLIIAPKGSKAAKVGNNVIELPDGIVEVITPVVYCVPFWLLGYYSSLVNDYDPDSLSMEKEEFKNSGLADLKKYY
jgi:glucosamine--fructose-6-phosphate aminotransferase (isomerizing)